MQPEEEFIARGWAYNVFNITNSLATTYTFQLKGESKGSQGAPAHFLGQVVVVNNSGPKYGSKYLEMNMLTPLYVEASVPVTPEDSQIYLECNLRKVFFRQKMGLTIFNIDLTNLKIPLQTSFSIFERLRISKYLSR